MGSNKPDATGFGTKLKSLREAARLSQAELADKAGMNVFGVAKLEQGQREPSWATVLALASALGVECTAFSTDPVPESEASKPEQKLAPKKKQKGKPKK